MRLLNCAKTRTDVGDIQLRISRLWRDSTEYDKVRCIRESETWLRRAAEFGNSVAQRQTKSV